MNISKSTAIALCAGTMMVAAGGAYAGNVYFKPDGGAAVGYWDDTDISNWWSNEACSTRSSQFPKGSDLVLLWVSGTTAIVTNDVPTLLGYTRHYALSVGTTTAGGLATLIVKDGGVVQTRSTDIGGTKNGNGRRGVLVIENGGSLVSTDLDFTLGNLNGFGIITNAGTIAAANDIKVGNGAGGYGRWVHDGGAESPFSANTKNFYVGVDGQGELIVKSGVFSGGCNKDGYDSQGIIAIGGTNTVTSRVEVQDGATFKNGFWYVGGYPGHLKGRGEIALRGGTICCGVDMHGADYKRNSMLVGVGRNDGGAIDPDCFGRIIGWGDATNAEGVSRYRSIHMLLGNGEIVADGEGVARALDLSQIYQVTNALVGVSGNTNGWRAVRKGVVKMPFSYLFGAGRDLSGAKCVGCDMNGARPDLVNSFKIELTRNGYTGTNCYAYAEFYAEDRDDVHLDELKGDVSILGVWRIGTFKDEKAIESAKVEHGLSAKLSFRYDQAKVQKATSAIELYRYVESDGKWTLLTRLESSQIPADFVIESPTGLGNTGETFNLGLFAVVENFHSPTVISVK